MYFNGLKPAPELLTLHPYLTDEPEAGGVAEVTSRAAQARTLSSKVKEFKERLKEGPQLDDFDNEQGGCGWRGGFFLLNIF